MNIKSGCDMRKLPDTKFNQTSGEVSWNCLLYTSKVYPNDPCPCGSGKKYKQCCGRKNKA